MSGIYEFVVGRYARTLRTLKRGMWKAINLLIVLTMLLPNFTSLVDVGKAAGNQPTMADNQLAVENVPLAKTSKQPWELAIWQKPEAKISTPADSLAVEVVNPTLSDAAEPSLVPTDTVSLQISAEPGFVTPGGQVLMTWEITGWDTLGSHEDMELIFSVPSGFIPPKNQAGNFDLDTNTYHLPISAAQGQIHWQVSESFAEHGFIQANLYSGENLLAQRLYEFGSYEVFTIAQSGGSASALGGRLKVDFPAGAISEDVALRVGKPGTDTRPNYSLSGQPFEILAMGIESNREISTFKESISIEIGYTEEDALWGGREPVGCRESDMGRREKFEDLLLR